MKWSDFRGMDRNIQKRYSFKSIIIFSLKFIPKQYLLQIMETYSSRVHSRSAEGIEWIFKALSNSSLHSCIRCSTSGNRWLCSRVTEFEVLAVVSCNCLIFWTQESISLIEVAVFTTVSGCSIIFISFETAFNLRLKSVGSDCVLALGSSKTVRPRVSSLPSGLSTYLLWKQF